ncbi:MAG: VanZ family protein [candidate division KSB1 bacterium]|jgi:glycopeptide antibiotics resistance protein|nr:VanZ family protein [candidate division KSB1 bacterium]
MKNQLRSLIIITMLIILMLTLKPFRMSARYLVLDETFWEKLLFGILVHDFLLNILLFLPFGFLMKAYTGYRKRTIALLGVAFAFSIESLQLFLHRTSTIADILANGLGALAGAMIAERVSYAAMRDRLLKRTFVILGAYTVLLAVAAVSVVRLNGLSNWSGDYHLMLGNENDLSRPWKGTVYELKIFGQSMDPDQIILSETDGQSRALVAHYRFEPDSLPVFRNLSDRIGLDLHYIDTGSKDNEHFGEGISFEDGEIIRSRYPAKALTELLKESSQFTCALRFKTAELQQFGPARIVSISDDPGLRNFTIGQRSDRFSVRVRTPLNGLNGSRCEYFSMPALRPEEIQQLVVSYHRCGCRVYLNGERLRGTREHLFDCVVHLLDFGTHLPGRVAFLLLLTMPFLIFYIMRQSVRSGPVSKKHTLI